MGKEEVVHQIFALMQSEHISMADLLRPLSAPGKVSQVHITGGRWIEDLSPAEWASRGSQAYQPSDTYEMEFDAPFSQGPDGSVWAWIGPDPQILPDRAS